MSWGRSKRDLPLDENGMDRVDRRIIKIRAIRQANKKPARSVALPIATNELDCVALEAEIARLKKEALTHAKVREEILKIAHSKPQIPNWTIGPRKTARSPGVPTIFLSDLHWGEVVDPNQIGGVNEYSLPIAQTRLRRVIEHTIQLLKSHMVNPSYPGICVCLGGDMLSGNIHEELAKTNEKEVMFCLLDLLGEMVSVIKIMKKEFGNVFLPCVTGNHGRNTLKMQAKDRHHTNFDWLLYQLLDRFFQDDPAISFFIPDGPDASYSIYGHRYLLTHGDQFRGGDGIIGMLGPVMRGDNKKRSRNSQIGMDYDTMLIGHWHQLIQMQRLIANGSLKGYDEYAYSGNFPFEPPRQACWITHPEKGITFQMPIHATVDHKPEPAEWVSVFKRGK